MDKTKSSIHAGYYHVTIGSTTSARLLTTNTERAFIITQLQDILSTRSLLEESTGYRRLASHIDLLAFSLLPHSIQLLVFAISFESASVLASLLMDRLTTFHSLYSPHAPHHRHSITQIQPLLGPYEALDTSTFLHLSHKDWEYDRYSSVGFYLHDRRGDWMRLWRLAQLYDNDPSHYMQLLQHAQQHATIEEALINEPFETSKHG